MNSNKSVTNYYYYYYGVTLQNLSIDRCVKWDVSRLRALQTRGSVSGITRWWWSWWAIPSPRSPTATWSPTGRWSTTSSSQKLGRMNSQSNIFVNLPNIFLEVLSNNFRDSNFKYFFRRELRLQKEAEKRTETMNNVSKSVNLEEEIDWVSDLRTKKSEYWKFIVSSDPNAFSHSHHNKKIVSCCCVGVDCVRHSSAVKS